MLDPFEFLLPANNCVELLRCFVDEDSCVGGDGRSQLFLGRLWRIELKHSISQAKFLRLDFWQPLDRLEGRGLF